MPRKVAYSPRYLDVEITSRCNLSCRYCYHQNNRDVDYVDLPTDRWLDFFRELGACQVMGVSLCGGEPLLRNDFLALIDGLVANRMRFDLLTNGGLMTERVAQHLKATGRCDMVQVSLDGSRAEIHEKLRGAGTFEPALRGIGIAQQAGLPVTVRVTVTPYNIDDLPAIARLLLEDLGLRNFSTNASSSLGSREKYGEKVLLSPGERLRAMRLLGGLAENYPGRILANAGPLADWTTFHAMEQARRDGQPIPGRGKLVGCGCIFERLAVRADGAFVPCVMLPQTVLGQVGSDLLTEVWTGAEVLARMRQRIDIPLAGFAECHCCPWRESCTGNCPGSAYSLTGEINSPCMATCMKRFMSAIDAEGLSLWSR